MTWLDDFTADDRVEVTVNGGDKTYSLLFNFTNILGEEIGEAAQYAYADSEFCKPGDKLRNTDGKTWVVQSVDKFISILTYFVFKLREE